MPAERWTRQGNLTSLHHFSSLVIVSVFPPVTASLVTCLFGFDSGALGLAPNGLFGAPVPAKSAPSASAGPLNLPCFQEHVAYVETHSILVVRFFVVVIKH